MKTSLKDRERVKRWKQENRNKGLCRDCTKKAMPGKNRCIDHVDYRHKRWVEKGV